MTSGSLMLFLEDLQYPNFRAQSHPFFQLLKSWQVFVTSVRMFAIRNSHFQPITGVRTVFSSRANRHRFLLVQHSPPSQNSPEGLKTNQTWYVK